MRATYIFKGKGACLPIKLPTQPRPAVHSPKIKAYSAVTTHREGKGTPGSQRAHFLKKFRDDCSLCGEVVEQHSSAFQRGKKPCSCLHIHTETHTLALVSYSLLIVSLAMSKEYELPLSLLHVLDSGAF